MTTPQVGQAATFFPTSLANDRDPFPAVVREVWEDGSVDLDVTKGAAVFLHEAVHVRAAPADPEGYYEEHCVLAG